MGIKSLLLVSVGSIGLLVGCVRSSVMPLAADMIQISTKAAPVCSHGAAQNVAIRRAAVETINRGYDRFLVVNAQMQSQVVGYTPGSATTNGSAYAMGTGGMVSAYGTSTTTYSAPMPMIANTQNVVIKMFKDGDPAGANAIPARSTLGSDWQKIAKESTTSTC